MKNIIFVKTFSAFIAFLAVGAIQASAVEFEVAPSATNVDKISGVYQISFPTLADDGIYIANSQNGVQVDGPEDISEQYALAMGDALNVVTFNISPALTVDGDYLFTISAGTLANTETDEAISEVSFTITVDDNAAVLDYSLSRELNGSALQGEYSVTLLKYEGHDLQWTSLSPQRVFMCDGNGNILKTKDGASYHYASTVTKNVVTFTAEPPLAYAGDYILNISGYTRADNGAEIEEIFIPFTLTGDESLQPKDEDQPQFDNSYALNPDNSVAYQYLEGNIVIYYPNVESFSSVGGMASVSLPDGSEIASIRINDGHKINQDNAGYIQLGKRFTQEGEYVFRIPKRVFQNNDGIYNDAFEFTYIVSADGVDPAESVEVVDYNAAIMPEEGEYEALTSFVVTFPDIAKITLNETAAPSQFPHIRNLQEDGSEIANETLFTQSFPKDNTVEIKLSVENFNIPGKYVLVLPAQGQLLLDDTPLQSDVKFYYTISAETGNIELIREDKNYGVANLNGVVISKQADSSAINSLSPGIYIINGKKIQIK